MFKFKQLFFSDSVGISLRVLVAAIGGYFLSMVSCLWLVELFGLPEQEGRRLINLLFFLIYLIVIIWAFTPRAHWRAVVGISAATAVLWVGWWVLGEGVA